MTTWEGLTVYCLSYILPFNAILVNPWNAPIPIPSFIFIFLELSTSFPNNLNDKIHNNEKKKIPQCRNSSKSKIGAVVIVWQLDLQLPVQSVTITTKVLSSYPIHGEVYSI